MDMIFGIATDFPRKDSKLDKLNESNIIAIPTCSVTYANLQFRSIFFTKLPELVFKSLKGIMN
jgi:hypothetical protein